MASEEDRQHAERLRYDYTRRLHLLEQRVARQGDMVDPVVIFEIEELRTNIAGLDMIVVPAPAPAVRAAIDRAYDSYNDLLIAQLGSFNRRLTGVEEQVTGVAQQHTAAQIQRLALAGDVQALMQERHARVNGQRFNRVLLIIIALGVVVIALGIVF